MNEIIFRFFFFAYEPSPLCLHLTLACIVFVVKYGFAHRSFVFKRILKCHPDLIDFFIKTWPNLLKIWHLAEWNEVLSCCLVSKLHLLFVKIRCCSQDWVMNSCNFCTRMSVESNWIAFDHYRQSRLYVTLSFCFQSFCIQDIKTL